MDRNACVPYMEKSRNYYAAHGYDKPYRWAHCDDIPFTPYKKPLQESTVTVVTTAMPGASYVRNRRRLARGDLQQPPASVFTGDLAWDAQATHTDDRETYLPVRELNLAVDEGLIGNLAAHFYCAPTQYSARQTVEQDAPAIVQSCQDEGVDVALLVPL